jgi:Zn-dependent M28 family amino/carboxypeptidase
MLYKKSLSALLAFVILASQAAARQDSSQTGVVEAERLRRHVTYLASDKLEGRRTGEPGAVEAANYVAVEFQRLHLHPPVELPEVLRKRVTYLPADYMQEFPYVAGVELGKGNALTATRRVGETTKGMPMAIDFKVGEDWMPLGFSSDARVQGPVAFVGFGIKAADQNYDDYKGTDVRDRIAVALSGTPDGDNPHSRFTRAGELRFKAAAARAAGARALVVVAAEEKFTDDRLSRLRYDNAGSDAGLPVAVISRQSAAKILGLGNTSVLAEVEKAVREWTAASHKEPAEGDWFTRVKVKTPGGAGVSLSLTTDIIRRNAPASNVVGVLEGSDPKLKDEVIVIGAHYDHLGRGGEGSLAAREGEIHHGADDNASGTAGLLELARLFSRERERMRRTVVFVAFGGEEEGLIGSSFYVQHPARPLAQTVAMVNMDMIGRLKDGALTVGGVGTADVWRDWLARANGTLSMKVKAGATPTQEAAPPSDKRDSSGGASPSRMDNELTVVTGIDGRPVATATPAERFQLRTNEDGYGPSDHSSFYSKQVPVLFFFTGSHEDYHKPTDTADRVNYDGEAHVLEFVREIVYDLQDADKRPVYAVAKSDGPTRSTGFRVYLGTIPSYADSTDGLKLDGVREGSPAQAAGLAAGDLVVKLAGRDVRNVYDYTQALSDMKAGQEYEVELMRGGQRLTLKIVPAARK